MGKQGGLGDQLFIGGYDIAGDIQALDSIHGGPAAWDTTDITLSAMSRLGLERDGGIDATSYFNPTAGRSHARLSALPTADVIVTYCRGTTLGNPAACLVGKQIDYAGTRGADGSFTFKTSAQANGYGLEWGRQGTAGKRTDGSATNGSSVDLGSSSPGAFGLQMYVHLFAFTGTSVTIKLQESSDNGSGDAFADITGATTGAQTGITALRVATAAINVEQYVRVVTTGTFSSAVFHVMFVRNDTSVVF
jgi:hypothetical protein